MARPAKLFIAADGPRGEKIGEYELCKKAREVTNKVDWPCDVKKRFQEKNLGCKINASTAVTWFFENVSEGIILEDDCLPVASFFPYCRELLEHYRNSPQIMQINGTNLFSPEKSVNPTYSYTFSRCPILWGWATWRRAWQQYDISMTHLDDLINIPRTEALFSNEKYLKFLIKHCKHIRDKNVDTWDAQWQYTLMYNGGYAITPYTNLVENIGFGPDATHTNDSKYIGIPTTKLVTPLKHPPIIVADKRADALLIKKLYMRSIVKKVTSRIHKYLSHKKISNIKLILTKIPVINYFFNKVRLYIWRFDNTSDPR
jgi:hypothetical protein